jgi:Fic family protein
LLFTAVEKMVDEAKGGFVLTPDTLKELHRLVIQDLYNCAGKLRTQNVALMRNGVIDNTQHQPPPWEYVISFVDETCKYVNENFGRSPIHLAAYAMWRVNWVHPFMGGNGRTSRAVSYLLLNVRLGFNLPGENTIPQQIENDRNPYYDALHHADQTFATSGKVDVSVMEALLSQALAVQLLSVHDKACASAPTQPAFNAV